MVNIFKQAFDFMIVLTCILQSFTLYVCGAQRALPQESLLAISDEIDAEDVQSEKHLREFNSWDLKQPNKSEKIKEAIKRIQENPDSSLIDRVLVLAYTLQMEGNITEATEKWHAIVNITAEIDKVFAAQALLSVGYLLQEDNKDNEALPIYNKAIHLVPNYSRAFYHRGMLKDALHEHEAAASDYQRAIVGYNELLGLNPSNVSAYLYRGRVKMRLKQYESALTDFNQAIRLDSNNIELYFDRGYAQVSLGQYEAALDDYDKVIELEPDNAYAYSNRGSAKLKLGQNASAILDYSAAIRLKLDDAYVYSNRAKAKLHLGQNTSAITDLDKAIRLNPDYAGAYKSRGKVKIKLEKYEAAIADFDEAIRLSEAAIQEQDLGNPNLFVAYDAYMNRAEAKESLGFVDKAESDRQIARALLIPSLINKLDADVEKKDLD